MTEKQPIDVHADSEHEPGLNRFFRAALADELAALLDAPVAPALQLRGLVTNDSGTKRANRVEVFGVDRRFYSLGPGGNPFGDAWREGVVLNEPLAAHLAVGAGDEVVLRIGKPTLMPADAALSPDADLSMAFRMKIGAVAGESAFGRFSLQANQIAPLNAFVPLEWLQEKFGPGGHANMLLIGAPTSGGITLAEANEAVRKCFQPFDVGLEFRQLPRQGVIEIRSRRIFIDDFLAHAAMNVAHEPLGLLTYFVNELRHGDRATPYSLVTAMGRSREAGGLIPANMRDDEILINRWLADDLDAKQGDLIELAYYVLGPMRKLHERTSALRVRDILPLAGAAADPELMPDFPGLADVENCRDWKPGISINLKKIRKRDEDYWNRYRGTPKAFVTLSAGRRMWGNRFGNMTAVRYPLNEGPPEELAARVLNAVDPALAGLYFQPVRARGIKAGDGATDFGQLFLGFSMFLIAAALVSMGLLFVFGVEKRSEQTGMLLAVGISPKMIRRLFLLEGGALAALGAAAGAAAGLLYTRAMIYGLATLWREAVGDSAIHFYAKPSTIVIGALAGTAISLIAIRLTLRKQMLRPARELLSAPEGQFFESGPGSKRAVGLWVGAAAIAGALILLVVMKTGKSAAMAGAFFGAGALLLIAELGLTQALLQALRSKWNRPAQSLAGLGVRNAARRTGRSLAVVGMLAAACFLIVAVGANRHDPLAEAHRRDSGTGGFALFGESSIGILHDLNSDGGRTALGLDDKELDDVRIVQLRVRDGDDASCLNLNRSEQPRLLGVQPAELRRRKAFGFIGTTGGVPKEDGWALLEGAPGGEVVPAVGDYTTIVWALGKSIGDELEYSDERGRTFRLRLVGMVKNSILQGSLIIDADEFVKRFPSEDGYRTFLVDAPRQKADRVMEKLANRLRDFGIELTPATRRLAEFNAVEHTYLSIFQLLGGLGLILGSAGLALVVLRNVLERRGELAMLQAVGFGKKALKRMVLYEHCGLMLLGLSCGVAAALVAVGPALKSSSTEVPYVSLIITIAAIGVSGIASIWIAAAFALSGRPLDALRNE